MCRLSTVGSACGPKPFFTRFKGWPACGAAPWRPASRCVPMRHQGSPRLLAPRILRLSICKWVALSAAWPQRVGLAAGTAALVAQIRAFCVVLHAKGLLGKERDKWSKADPLPVRDFDHFGTFRATAALSVDRLEFQPCPAACMALAAQGITRGIAACRRHQPASASHWPEHGHPPHLRHPCAGRRQGIRAVFQIVRAGDARHVPPHCSAPTRPQMQGYNARLATSQHATALPGARRASHEQPLACSLHRLIAARNSVTRAYNAGRLRAGPARAGRISVCFFLMAVDRFMAWSPLLVGPENYPRLLLFEKVVEELVTIPVRIDRRYRAQRLAGSTGLLAAADFTRPHAPPPYAV